MSIKEGTVGGSMQAGSRIRIRLGGKSVLYFQEPPALVGGQRGIYVFERRVAGGGNLPSHTFEEHMFLLPVGCKAVPFKSVLNGRRLSGHIEPWRFRFLAAGDTLSTSWSTPIDSILVAIHPSTLHRMVHADPGHSRPELVSRITAHEDPVLMHLALALQSYLISGGRAGQLFETSLLSVIAGRLLFSYGNGRGSTVGRTVLPRWKLTRIDAYVHDNLAHVFTLNDVAALVEMSPYQLCRTFRGTTGQTIWQYVLQCRVQAAMSQISGRRLMSLAQVARDCGFQSYSQFIAAFRKITGCLPSEYRRM